MSKKKKKTGTALLSVTRVRVQNIVPRAARSTNGYSRNEGGKAIPTVCRRIQVSAYFLADQLSKFLEDDSFRKRNLYESKRNEGKTNKSHC